MVMMVLFVCCCPCVVWGVLYATGLYRCLFNVLEDCKDALVVRAAKRSQVKPSLGGLPRAIARAGPAGQLVAV